jgi:hypothetical protein
LAIATAALSTSWFSLNNSTWNITKFYIMYVCAYLLCDRLLWNWDMQLSFYFHISRVLQFDSTKHNSRSFTFNTRKSRLYSHFYAERKLVLHIFLWKTKN